MKDSPDICPNCGALLPNEAKACPECGSCEETGWSDKATLDNLGVPDDEFDYDAFISEEFEGGSEKRNREAKIKNMVISAILLALFLWWIL